MALDAHPHRVPPVTARIVIIDDEPEVCELLSRVLTRAGYEVRCALSGEEGLGSIRAGEIDCLVVDKQLPGMHGGEVAAEARRRIPGLPVVLITAHPEPFSLGVERPDVCLAKPFKSLQAIEDAVVLALESGASMGPLSELRQRLTQVVAEIAPGRKKRA